VYRPRAAAAILVRRALGALPASLCEALHLRARQSAYGAADAVLGQWIDPVAADWCAAHIAALGPDAVLIDTIFRAPLLTDPRLERYRRVIIAHDLFHHRHAALAARGYRLYPASLSRAEEIRWLALADTIVAIQPAEAGEIAAMLTARARVIVASMAVEPRPRPDGVGRIPNRLVFLGSASVHNVDGLRWFLDRVWPRVRAARPTVRLDVCGDVCGALGRAPDGLVLHGRMAELAPVLHRASLGVAPLRAGSGLKIKLLDLMAHGLAVVTTPIGAAGFEPAVARPLLIAEEDEAFAEAILGALERSADARDEAVLAYAARYGREAVFAALGTTLGV
jgi:glycosyltransferase involved in cell wall biosynthesis